MIRFVCFRLLQSLIALAILSVVVFVLARATGDPLHMILPMSATEEDYANARQYLGLDRPYVEQYLTFVGRAATGDFGNSIRARRPVSEILRERLPNSLRLALFAMTVSLAMAFPLGVLAAVKKGTGLDRAAQVISVLGQSLPSFWVAIILVEFVAGRWQWLPAGGNEGFTSYILPGFTLGWFVVAGLMRLLRSGMLEVLDSEYVKLARLKGVAESRHVRGNLLLDPGDDGDRGGDGLRVARSGPAGLRGHQLARLPGDPGRRPHHRRHRHRRQPRGRSPLRGHRPAHPVRAVSGHGR